MTTPEVRPPAAEEEPMAQREAVYAWLREKAEQELLHLLLPRDAPVTRATLPFKRPDGMVRLLAGSALPRRQETAGAGSGSCPAEMPDRHSRSRPGGRRARRSPSFAVKRAAEGRRQGSEQRGEAAMRLDQLARSLDTSLAKSPGSDFRYPWLAVRCPGRRTVPRASWARSARRRQP
jgi:hypothetical protein